MATVFLIATRRLGFLSAYRAWRFSRLRKRYITCTSCGCTHEADPTELLQGGHYRAAVFMARLQLEKLLQSMCHEFRSERDWRHVSRSGALMGRFLQHHGRISARMANRIEGAYRIASRVVHGRACPSDHAYMIVKRVTEVVMALERCDPPCESSMKAAGFAEGGAA